MSDRILLENLTAGSVIPDLPNTGADNHKWEGTGVLDKLLQVLNSNLDMQYRTGRIDGKDYANVYLGSMQTLISESLNFLLQKEQAEADIKIKEKNLELLEVDLMLKYKQLEVMEAERQQTIQQTANLAAEGLNIPKQGLLLDAQVLQVGVQTQLTTQQIENLEAELLNIPKQGLLLDGQKGKLEEEILMIIQQTLNLSKDYDIKLVEELTLQRPLPEAWLNKLP